MQERNALEDGLGAIGRIERELDDQLTMIELGEAEKDAAVIAEAEAALKRLQAEAARRELEALLSGEADGNDAFLEVQAGAGGTESQDWAEMLLRMYTRWAEQHGYKVEYLEETAGEGAGIKSAHGADQGPQRLRLAQGRERRAPPGAHLAVRFQRAAPHLVRQRARLSGDRRPHRHRHQGERRAHRHDARARRRRPARQQDRQRDPPHAHPDQHRGAVPAGPLPAQEPRHGLGHAARQALRGANCSKREEKAAAEQAAKTDIGWGHQIRSYVLQPYQMVKDLRTGVSTSDTSGVLDGDLDQFMQAVLAQKAFGTGPENVEDVE